MFFFSINRLIMPEEGLSRTTVGLIAIGVIILVGVVIIILYYVLRKPISVEVVGAIPAPVQPGGPKIATTD